MGKKIAIVVVITCTNFPISLFAVGMTKNPPPELKLNATERQLIEQLREHPEMRERFPIILVITPQHRGSGQAGR